MQKKPGYVQQVNNPLPAYHHVVMNVMASRNQQAQVQGGLANAPRPRQILAGKAPAPKPKPRPAPSRPNPNPISFDPVSIIKGINPFRKPVNIPVTRPGSKKRLTFQPGMVGDEPAVGGTFRFQF